MKYKQRVIEYFKKYPHSSYGRAAKDLGVSKSTIWKYKPNRISAMSSEEAERFLEKARQEEQILARISWETVRAIRNANSCRLYSLDWDNVRIYFAKRQMPIPGGFKSGVEFEWALKQLCHRLYGWHLYETCPCCGEGICIPVWPMGAYSLFCGCSNYPNCNYAVDREGKPLIFNKTVKEDD